MIKGLLFLFLYSIVGGCDERGEIGGSHGDRDNLQEESFVEDADLPPDISDPRDVGRALRENPSNPYFGWSHLQALTGAKTTGHVYYANKGQGRLEASVNLVHSRPSTNHRIVLATTPCDRPLQGGYDTIGTVQTDDHGRLSSRSLISPHQGSGMDADGNCLEETKATWVLIDDKPVACGALQCVEPSQAH